MSLHIEQPKKTRAKFKESALKVIITYDRLTTFFHQFFPRNVFYRSVRFRHSVLNLWGMMTMSLLQGTTKGQTKSLQKWQ